MDSGARALPGPEERLGHKGRELSGGEQQMLAIARALLTGPELLLLDEPSQGLAPLVVNAVMDTIRELKAERVSMLLVEQNAEMALQLADRVYVIDHGTVVFEGAPARLRADANRSPRLTWAWVERHEEAEIAGAREIREAPGLIHSSRGRPPP